MTVSTSISTANYTANGSTTTFAYPFKIFANSDLVVSLRNTATSVETVQVLNSAYTVTGAGNNAGGNVVFGTAPASGNTVLIRRELPLTQETDFVPNDPFPAAAHENALDKLTMLLQQTGVAADRAIVFPASEVGLGLTNVLPSVSDRRLKLIQFANDGSVDVIAPADLSNAIIGANYVFDAFTGSGATTIYTLSAGPGSTNNTAVYIDGVYQSKNNYSVSGSTLTFSTAPPLNSAIEIVIGDAISAGAATAASAVSYSQGGTGSVSRNVQSRLRDYVSVKDFGAVGDGVTDDTAAIQAALDYADTGSNQSSVVTVFIPAGTYIHTGITIAGGVNVMGDGRTSTTLFLKNSTNPVQSVKLESSRASISKVTIDGNRSNNSSGIGLNADNSVAAGNSAFCYIEDLDIQNTAGTGCIVTNGNMAHLKNVSITRCTTGLIAERCTQLTMTNVDIAKFTVAGFVMQGSPAQNVVVWNGGFMETTVDTPTAGAPFIHLKSMRSTDALYIAGLWCNGHFTDSAFDTTGLKIEDPLYVDNVTIDGTVFYNVKTAGTYVGVANTEIGLVDARGISTVGGGGSFTRQMGVLTQASYNFDFFTNEKSLTVSGTTNEFIVPTGSPIEIQEMSMLVTEAFAGTGNGALNFGVNGSGTAFGSGLVLTNPTTLNTVVDFTSSLTSKKSSLSFDKITFAAATPLATTGKARFKVRGIVY